MAHLRHIRRGVTIVGEREKTFVLAVGGDDATCPCAGFQQSVGSVGISHTLVRGIALGTEMTAIVNLLHSSAARVQVLERKMGTTD